METQASAEIITREQVIEFLALIATGGKQSTLSREEGLELLLQIARDRKIAIEDRLDAIRAHARMEGHLLSERHQWVALSALTNGEHRESVDLVTGQSFLDEHRATLVPDGPKWLLRYPIACYEYGSRLEECVDCEIPIPAKNYDVALLIAKVILREHVAPAAEPEAHSLDTPGTPYWAADVSWSEGGVSV